MYAGDGQSSLRQCSQTMASRLEKQAPTQPPRNRRRKTRLSSVWAAPVPVGFEISTAAVVARGRTETVRVGTHVAELGVAYSVGVGDRWGLSCNPFSTGDASGKGSGGGGFAPFRVIPAQQSTRAFSFLSFIPARSRRTSRY